MARTIILGYDGSECAKAALDAAVDIALDSPGSRIVVVNGHAVRVAWGGRYVRTEPGDLEDLKRHAQASIQPLLDEASARIEAAGVPVEATLEWETASAALLDVAQKHRADLIVVGAHGIDATGRAIGRVLLGSTSSRLLHYSDVPVLVVPHGD